MDYAGTDWKICCKVWPSIKSFLKFIYLDGLSDILSNFQTAVFCYAIVMVHYICYIVAPQTQTKMV